MVDGNAMMRNRKILFVLSLLLLPACTETSTESAKKAKEPEKPPDPVTGRYAFHQMYTTARGWLPDAQPLRVNSIYLTQVKSDPGKAGAWQAAFISEGRGRARSYTYSILEAEGNLHKGVFAGNEESYTPRGQAQPFSMQALKIDTDDAYQTAIKKGADYAKKNPGKPISFLLERTREFPNPTWRVIWGESVGTSNFSIFVDATTGDYLRTMR
jgi:hypothetical protein